MAPSPSELALREQSPFNFAVVDEASGGGGKRGKGGKGFGGWVRWFGQQYAVAVPGVKKQL